jgi:hypothetical protein
VVVVPVARRGVVRCRIIILLSFGELAIEIGEMVKRTYLERYWGGEV